MFYLISVNMFHGIHLNTTNATVKPKNEWYEITKVYNCNTMANNPSRRSKSELWFLGSNLTKQSGLSLSQSQTQSI